MESGAGLRLAMACWLGILWMAGAASPAAAARHVKGERTTVQAKRSGLRGGTRLSLRRQVERPRPARLVRRTLVTAALLTAAISVWHGRTGCCEPLAPPVAGHRVEVSAPATLPSLAVPPSLPTGVTDLPATTSAPGVNAQDVPPPGAVRPSPAPESAAAPRPRFVAPLATPVLNSKWGYRFDPRISSPFFHNGLDFDGPLGAPVLAARGGKVTFAGWAPRGHEYRAYGLHIIIDHGDGYQTLYGHLSALRVQKGQEVDEAQPIGALGSTGASSGPHLHFEVRHARAPTDDLGDQTIDPLPLLSTPWKINPEIPDEVLGGKKESDFDRGQ
jgi:hypothetical protein